MNIIFDKNLAEQLKEKGYYHTWTQEDIDKIVTWRYNS